MIKSILSILSDESLCAYLLRLVRWSNGIYCIYCNSTNIKKYGRYKKVFQRYYCKDCNHTFNDKSNTIFHYKHVRLSDWFIAIYLAFVISWIGLSINSISKQLSLSYRVTYYMIRAIMDKISSLEYDKLYDDVEIDELYIHAGMKGRNYHNRVARRRGIKPYRGRGTFDKDVPMIICYHQRNGNTIFDVPIDNIISLACKRVEYASNIYTDDLAYDRLEEYGFNHYSINHSNEYAKDNIHINNCENRANLLRIWLSKFMGINKYNLNLYVKAYNLYIILEVLTALRGL